MSKELTYSSILKSIATPKSLQSVCIKKGLVRGYTLMFEWDDEDEQ